MARQKNGSGAPAPPAGDRRPAAAGSARKGRQRNQAGGALSPPATLAAAAERAVTAVERAAAGGLVEPGPGDGQPAAASAAPNPAGMRDPDSAPLDVPTGAPIDDAPAPPADGPPRDAPRQAGDAGAPSPATHEADGRSPAAVEGIVADTATVVEGVGGEPDAVAAAGAPVPGASGDTALAPLHAGSVAGAGGLSHLSVDEVCRLVQVHPEALRPVLDAFGDILDVPAAGGAGPLVPAPALGALAAAVRWSGEGLAHGEIRRRLQSLTPRTDGHPGEPGAGASMAEHEAAAAAEAVSAAPEPESEWRVLLAQVGRLHTAIARSEERWAEDRDRLLMTLLRTHQELQSLRVEMSPRSRRNRRRGLWARLWG